MANRQDEPPIAVLASPRLRIVPHAPMSSYGDFEPVSETLETVVRTSEGDKVIARVERAYVRRVSGGDFVGHAASAQDAANLAAARHDAETERRANASPFPRAADDDETAGGSQPSALAHAVEMLAWSPPHAAVVSVPGIVLEAFDTALGRFRRVYAAYSSIKERDEVVAASVRREQRLFPLPAPVVAGFRNRGPAGS